MRIKLRLLPSNGKSLSFIRIRRRRNGYFNMHHIPLCAITKPTAGVTSVPIVPLDEPLDEPLDSLRRGGSFAALLG